MNPDQRNQLLEKRAQLQIRIRFSEFVTRNIEPFLEVLEELQNSGIKYSVVSFRCIPLEFHELLQAYILKENLAKYKLSDVLITNEDKEVETVLEKYPSENPFRYVLDALVVGYGNQPDEVMRELMEQHQLSEKKVLICWLKYAFLLEMDLQDFIQNVNDDFMSGEHGDAVIFPRNHDWLIAYALEDEWRFARKHKIF
ncbi:hypothetical protein [Chryseobacterium koreense]|uniref:Uncharacterized protein n=1 Tax=Chryseobacterium koreense CCUG 49689 TaxID=1304281 RepID=A0A0J7LMM7_9FLAO|nr:hypothetical protein [Chryseobacterium koreense]KMQ70355.1 hypothetical protein ACM44_12750 [Chryseobacterium koreense CCUG 49689]MBB5334655.1 hypothetical protein [Chryseobacterium koreense]